MKGMSVVLWHDSRKRRRKPTEINQIRQLN